MRKTIIDSRYRILKKIGTGATGNVYKVSDLKDNRIIALKMLSKTKTSSETVLRFKREFILLAGLHHLNLCQVYDFGMLKDGRSYFTMEYIEGRDIFSAAKELSDKKIYPLIVQLCRVLEYIHAKGLIHYDLKPGNVLVRMTDDKIDNAIVKLMDFGLADERQLEDGTVIKGTFPYIAPEIIKGVSIDHRADLYSLGVLLYELFTRRTSHGREVKIGFAALLKKQKEQLSVRPSMVVKEIPLKLEQLITRLLAVEPADRFSRAYEVINEINRISGKRFGFETKKTMEGYLLSSRFVGRDKEMSTLQKLFGEVCQAKGQVVVVIGDAGIGKSRLIKEFKVFAELQHAHCFTGYAYDNKAKPLGPFYDIFKGFINHLSDISTLSREIRFSLAVLFKIFPDLIDGRLKRHLPKLVTLEPQTEKLRTFEALSELVRFVASDLGILVILLEDLHWADELSIQFLEYLGRNLADRNIFVCGTVRKQESAKNLVLKKMMDNLITDGYLSQIELKPLAYKNLHSFLDSVVTSKSNSVELVKYLLEKSGGNPFFVEELLRTLLRYRGVGIGERLEIEDLERAPIPETIDGIVFNRIKDVGRNSMMIIKFGAVLLKDFSFDLMKRLTDLDDTTLSMALLELKRRQILIEEANKYKFYHATLREAVNKRLTHSEKKALNYRIAKTLEFINRGRLGFVLEDLAHYFINAHDRKNAITYGLRAADRSSDQYAYEQAVTFYKGVLGLLANKNPRRCFNILLKLGQAERFSVFYSDAIKHYKKAISLKIGTIDKKIRSYLGIANIYALGGDYKKALYIYQSALGFIRKRKGYLANFFETYIKVKICRMHLERGDYRSAGKLDLNALRFSAKGLRGTESMRWLCSIYMNMGAVAHFKGSYEEKNYDKSILYYNKAYKYARKMKNEHAISIIQNNLGSVYDAKYDFQKAFNCYQRAYHLSEKMKDQHSIMIRVNNLGCLLKDKGCYLKALEYLQRCLSIAKKIRNSMAITYSSVDIGECYIALCDYRKARECFEKELKISDTMGWKIEKCSLVKGIGDIHRAMADYALALKFYRKALKISKEIKNQKEIGDSLTAIGSVFIDIGEFTKAHRYLSEALKIVTNISARQSEVECYINLCRMSMWEDSGYRFDYHEEGLKIARKIGMKQGLLKFYLLSSELFWRGGKYSRGIEIADKAIRLARDMGLKDLHVKALLMKVKNGIKYDILSKSDVIRILGEAKKIAEEIACPEILWKVYFEFGRFFQGDKQYLSALDYYEKCNTISESVGKKITNESYRTSYLNRPDLQLLAEAINEVAELLC